MKKLLCLTAALVLCLAHAPSRASAQVGTLVVYASKGDLNDVINADTLANGARKHDVYQLVSLDTTYKFAGTITSSKDISVIGVLQAGTHRPPCIQPKVLEDGSLPVTIFTLNGIGITGTFKNLYLLALASNNTANAAGQAFQVSADQIKLVVDNCVFDGWLGFGIGYNGQWDKFFVTNSQFRNLVHPNQHYVGEAIRNEWPGEAYTDTMSFKGNTMLCMNGYAAAPVTKFYQKYLEFTDNRVIYTFKNPFFIFNVTDAKINGNFFYANYAGGVDQAENPWWDNLFVPDTTYGVIAFEPLSDANKAMFHPADPALAEGLRTIEVKNNTYFWPKALTDFWTNWNQTQANQIRTPTFMNPPTQAMFADKATWPHLVEEGNLNVNPAWDNAIDVAVLNGTSGNDIGLLAYFTQIRTGTAASDVWGYAMTQVTGAADWKPEWPLPETAHIATGVEQERIVSRLPGSFALTSYPNPFNPSTNLQFVLDASAEVSLTVYDQNGRLVKNLLDHAATAAGSHVVRVDLGNRPSGIYLAVLQANQQKRTAKIMLMK